MLTRQLAKKATIVLPEEDGGLIDPVGIALMVFLNPKDVAGLNVFDRNGHGLEIQFFARPAKTDFLLGIVALIAPHAVIEVEDTTLIREQSAREVRQHHKTARPPQSHGE